ncbi:MAG: UDP-glucose 6-dehydrogenase, partial [Candidatus Electrothrix sp. GM3_4]|nr:UDP-glucose 6-dehydrogenase [Candidatus Electrothrix sp. GM3_4]
WVGVYEACEGADAVILMTEWNQYRALDFERLKGSMNTPIFIDLRNVYEPTILKNLGFSYVGVGRK